jgi:hypothetical protein
MTKQYLTYGLLVVLNTASAGPYVDLGVSVADGCIQDYDESKNRMGCSNNPLGSVAVGYQYKPFSIELEHRSSLVEKDKGINSINLKYRWEWKGDEK